jgi:hypothetical protein
MEDLFALALPTPFRKPFVNAARKAQEVVLPFTSVPGVVSKLKPYADVWRKYEDETKRRDTDILSSIVDPVVGKVRSLTPSAPPAPPSPNDFWQEIYGRFRLPDGVVDPRAAAIRDLMGRINLGEDPTQRQLRDTALQDVRNQLGSAQASIGQSFDRGRGELTASAGQMRADAAQNAADMAALFNAAAAQTQANNASTAAAIAADFGGMGVTEPVEGAAVDIAAEMAAAAPREQALATTIGDIYANTANTMAAAMGGYAANEQAAAGRDAAAMMQAINMEWAQREADRIAQERARQEELAMMLADIDAEPFMAAQEFWRAMQGEELANGLTGDPADVGDTSMYRQPIPYKDKDGRALTVPGEEVELAMRMARRGATEAAGNNDPDLWNAAFLEILQDRLGPAYGRIPGTWITENLRR